MDAYWRLHMVAPDDWSSVGVDIINQHAIQPISQELTVQYVYSSVQSAFCSPCKSSI